MVLYTGATVEEAIQKGLNDLDIPRMKAHITVVAREKKGFLGLFGKKLAQVEIEPIAETTVVKANQKAVKGVPDEINAQNEPVKTVSEATVDLGRVVAAIKKVEEEGEVVSEEIKTEILKHDKEADTVLEEKGHEHILEKVKEPATKESSESDFSNLGIEVELQAEEQQVQVAERRSGDFQLARMRWTADFTDPFTFLSMYRSNDSYNDNKTNCPEYDELMAQSNEESDPTARFELLHQAESVLVNDYCFGVPVLNSSNIYLVSTDITNFEIDPSRNMIRTKYLVLGDSSSES